MSKYIALCRGLVVCLLPIVFEAIAQPSPDTHSSNIWLIEGLFGQFHTYIVRPDGSGDFPTIQAAINAVSDGDTIELTNGIFTGNGNHDIDYLGKAITIRSQSANPDSCIIDCEGSGRGFYFHSGEGPESVLNAVTIRNANIINMGGGIYCSGSSPRVINCTMSGNQARHGGGICVNWWSSPKIIGCTIIGNRADYGGGIHCLHNSDSATTIRNCIINENEAVYYGGGICVLHYNPPEISNCTINGNSSAMGGGIYCEEHPSPMINHCTITGNEASADGGGISCYEDAHPTLVNTIITFSIEGQALYCDGTSSASLSCCDIYGNAGGDWMGCIAGQDTTNGNLSEDPLFCAPENSDFHICDISPCAPAQQPECGLIGASDVGCSSTGSGFVELIHPGPPDWGYRLHWVSGALSRLVFTNFCSGTIGSVSGAAATAGWTAANYTDSIVFSSDTWLSSGSIETFWLSHPYCSDYVTWTAGDSSGMIEGPLPVELTTFQAIAGDGQVTLRWQTASELDNDHFVLHKRKAGDGDFHKLAEIPGHGTTTEPHDYDYVDRLVRNGIAYEYQISDVDIAGRETVHEQIVSATPGAAAIPTEFALHAPYPNPFNPTTMIRYDVKEKGFVSLKVFDLLGREVATLVHGIVAAGSYSIEWNARDLPSGVYLCRMEAEGFVGTRKMMLLK